MLSFSQFIIEQELKAFHEQIELLFSEETEILDEKAKFEWSGQQAWGPITYSKGADDKKKELELRDFVKDKVYPVAEKDKQYFDKNIGKAAQMLGKAKARTTGLKPEDSIVNKSLKRGKPIEKMGDIVRGAIYVKSPEDMKNVDKILKKQFNVYKVDKKEFGGDKNWG
jgi:hypothetical protein